MGRRAWLLIVFVCYLGLNAGAGRYRASQYPQTTGVLQVVYGNEVRREHAFLSYAARAHEENAGRFTSLFGALARSEAILAENHRRLLGEFDMAAELPVKNGASLGATRHNLEILTNITLAKIDERYSVFVEMIRSERNAEATAAIQTAWEVKKRQRELVTKGLEASGLLGWTSKTPEQYYVCRMCGWIETERPTRRCAQCGAEALYSEPVGDEWMVHWAVEENSALDDAEKAYARRYLEGVALRRLASVDPRVFASEAYKKWGLGPQRPFQDEEKAYIASLTDMVSAWDLYHQIDLNNLSDSEKGYLAGLHDKYGQGAIDPSPRSSAADWLRTVQDWLGVVEALSGANSLSDADLIFIRRVQSP